MRINAPILQGNDPAVRRWNGCKHEREGFTTPYFALKLTPSETGEGGSRRMIEYRLAI
ncbi:MAG: hypothetical protein ABJC09_15805 [Terriglobia bacterium]